MEFESLLMSEGGMPTVALRALVCSPGWTVVPVTRQANPEEDGIPLNPGSEQSPG